MRVITGSARGKKLKTLEGYDVRPTTDKIKEAIFSIVQFDIEGRVVLDLFSGCGQLGIEALSRGAKKAYFVDNSRESVNVIRENVEHAGFSDKAVIKQMPSNSFVKSAVEKFDLAFLDPPYERKILQKTLPLLAEKMSEQGIIVCEHETGCRLPEEVECFSLHKQYKYGKTTVSVYRISDKTEEESEKETDNA